MPARRAFTSHTHGLRHGDDGAYMEDSHTSQGAASSLYLIHTAKRVPGVLPLRDVREASGSGAVRAPGTHAPRTLTEHCMRALG